MQMLHVAQRELTLENQLARLDRYHLVILDDFATVRKDKTETTLLFELISVRCELHTLLITANQPFEDWGKIFPDEITTVAAVDRLIHRAPILEMNVERSWRSKAQARTASAEGNKKNGHRLRRRSCRRLAARGVQIRGPLPFQDRGPVETINIC